MASRSTSAAPVVRATWLFGARADLFAFGFPVVFALALLAIGHAVGLRSTPPWAFLLCVVMVDVAHVHATAFRVYLDRVELRRRPLLYFGTPLLAYGVGVAIHLHGGAILFWRLLAYVAVFHFMRQQWGWVAMYRARAKETSDATLDWLAVHVAALYPLLVWHARLPRRFAWFVKGDFVPGVVPAFIVELARPIWLAILFAFALRQLHLVATKRAVNLGKCLVVFSTFFLWWLGIVALDSDWAFTVTNVLPHGIPYFVLIAAYSRRRYEKGEPKAQLASFLLRGGLFVAYGLLVAVALIEEGLWDRFVWHDHEHLFGEGELLSPRALAFLVPLLALPQAVHYALDGVIWRRAQNPALGRYLSQK
ncbi:MAG: hypothetical protein ACXVEF_15895 [Polyangiales bacterium]